MDIDAESCDGVHVKIRGRITVFFKHLLNAGYSSVELIDIHHHSHSFCHKRITIVVDRREVLRTGFPVKSACIHYFNVIVKLV